eukprot:CAMPEP_0116910492 /NCGR_PEP_ID=MMETSP0467-20121206/14913_1 /TAXON_ID=283647 /ORGANISM="Mesodinium pulex, Strain SPMC105" /LENGTH=66 /DNA_ID=CAMNT_0004586071 /DNA_START=1898 /DNA_END=2098 /DNA_ORIENTATION=+
MIQDGFPVDRTRRMMLTCKHSSDGDMVLIPKPDPVTSYVNRKNKETENKKNMTEKLSVNESNEEIE